LVLHRLPDHFTPETRKFHWWSIVLSVAVGVSATLAVWGLTGRRDKSDAARLYLEQAPKDTGGSNIVNTILVDYRAFDTFGELTVLGMAGIAIADWRLMYEDQADTLRAVQVSLFGGTPQEKPEQHAISSPITYAEAVRAPVLIIQGRNDTRTPARQVQVYAERLKALGKEVEVHWFEAGHLGPFADSELALDHQRRMLAFALRVLDRA